MTRYRFPHERLDAWHRACDARKLAEGAGRFKPAEKVQKFEIAGGEASEAAGAVQALLQVQLGDAVLGQRFVALEGRVGAMLTGLIRKHRR